MLALEGIGIDMPAGPSEVFIIANEAAKEIEKQLPKLSTKAHTRESLKSMV